MNTFDYSRPAARGKAYTCHISNANCSTLSNRQAIVTESLKKIDENILSGVSKVMGDYQRSEFKVTRSGTARSRGQGQLRYRLKWLVTLQSVMLYRKNAFQGNILRWMQTLRSNFEIGPRRDKETHYSKLAAYRVCHGGGTLLLWCSWWQRSGLVTRSTSVIRVCHLTFCLMSSAQATSLTTSGCWIYSSPVNADSKSTSA